MNVIRSQLHDVYTEEVYKVALSPKDDKRVIMEDGIHALAYGHYKLKKLRGFIGFDISVALFSKESTYMWFIYGRRFHDRKRRWLNI